MDPAAFGTALIGLDAIRRRQTDESAPHHAVTRADRRPRFASLRTVVAGALRATASALEPRATNLREATKDA
jgi:hypothetical protein